MRALNSDDYVELYRVASDKEIWAGHPSKDRYLETEFAVWFESALKSKAALLVLNSTTQGAIGSTRYYFPPASESNLSIGYTFLARAYWGGVTNYQLKSMMLNHAFAWYEAVWFHVAPSNIRSQKSVEKIGAVFVGEETIKLGKEPEQWYCYRISRNDWMKKSGKAC